MQWPVLSKFKEKYCLCGVRLRLTYTEGSEYRPQTYECTSYMHLVVYFVFRYFRKKVSTHEAFQLVLPKFQCTNICFWYIPERLRGKEQTEAWWQEIAKVCDYGQLPILHGSPLDARFLKQYFNNVPHLGTFPLIANTTYRV